MVCTLAHLYKDVRSDEKKAIMFAQVRVKFSLVVRGIGIALGVEMDRVVPIRVIGVVINHTTVRVHIWITPEEGEGG